MSATETTKTDFWTLAHSVEQLMSSANRELSEAVSESMLAVKSADHEVVKATANLLVEARVAAAAIYRYAGKEIFGDKALTIDLNN